MSHGSLGATCSFVVVLLIHSGLGSRIVHAQSISGGAGGHHARDFSPPVRMTSARQTQVQLAAHLFAEQDGVIEPTAEALPVGVWQSAPPSHAHRVIQPPARRPTSGKASHRQRSTSTRPPLLAKHRAMQPDPALIPQARQREVWKTPFSYGYFGASGTRQWSMHHGYRDRYTEWRLR